VALNLAPLRDVPVLRTAVTVYYRTVWIPPAGDPDPFHVRPGEGRWPTEWTLYTGSSDLVVWAEYCRNQRDGVDAADITGGVGLNAANLPALAHLQVPITARALYELDFAFERLADLTTPWGEQCLRDAGFELDDFYADPPTYGGCPELAALAGELQWEAVRVPSAALRMAGAWCIPVFEEGRRRLTDVRSSVPIARPTVAAAAATTYPGGARPGWLG
jgi:hypothetical protein